MHTTKPIITSLIVSVLLINYSGCAADSEARMASRCADVTAHLRACRNKTEAVEYLQQQHLEYWEGDSVITTAIRKPPTIADLGYREGYYIVVKLDPSGNIQSVSGETAWTGL
jgi:hypothetical protein